MVKRGILGLVSLGVSSRDAFAGDLLEGSCTAPLLPSVPTLSDFGIVLLAMLLIVAGTMLLVRRSRPAAGVTSFLVFLTGLLFITSSGVWAHVIQTSQGRVVSHKHRPRQGEQELTAAEMTFKELVVTTLIAETPGTRTKVFDATLTYNCHGKSFDGAWSWLDDPSKFLDDDFGAVVGNARLGDIVVYRNNGIITHSGIVTGIDANGNVTEVCSKWGDLPEYTHKPDEVLQGEMGMVGGRLVRVTTYGTPSVFRRN